MLKLLSDLHTVDSDLIRFNELFGPFVNVCTVLSTQDATYRAL